LNTCRPSLYLDGFSATGVRGLRAEIELGIRTVMVERSRKSFDMLQRNVEKNHSESEIYNDTFESIVSKFRFDFIDIDPYGDVVPYVDIALHYIRNRGFIGFTATDLSVLTGSLKDHTFRRYGSVVMNSALRHEMGIRNLIGFIGRRAINLERGIDVRISAYHGHFYRVIVQVNKGSEEAQETMDNIGYFNPYTELSNVYENFPYGPIWTGKIENLFSDCELVIPSGVDEKHAEVFRNLRHEDRGLFFVDIGEIFSRKKINLPSLKHAMEYLNENGMESQRTHFSHTGIKVLDQKIASEELLEKFRSNTR
jgi:tRNA (guanine26-N2/guanine27-N2)-dimethyltransferase